MRTMQKLLAAGATVALALAMSAPASAATVVKPVVSGVFDLNNDIGTIEGIRVRVADTTAFTFTLGGVFDVIMQLQAANSGAVAVPISFDLYKGSPLTGVKLLSSAYTTGPAIEAVLDAGDYYMQITKVGVDRELVSGSLTLSAIPEPATWALMIGGFGLMGATLRRRQMAVA